MSQTLEKKLPCSDESEYQVIGGLLLLSPEQQAKIDDVSRIVSPDDFYSPDLVVIYRTILDLHSQDIGIDIVLVKQQVAKKIEGRKAALWLTDIMDRVVTSANILRHAQIVKENSIRRTAIEQAHKLIESAYDGYDLNAAIENIQVISTNGHIEKSYHHVSELTVDCVSRIENISKGELQVSGYPTGFYDLDDKITGLMPADLIILAARPAMGKTSLACNIALNMAKQGQRVVFFSLETSIKQLIDKLLIQHSKTNSQRMRSGRLDTDDWQKITDSLADLTEIPILIDDRPSQTPSDLSRTSRQIQKDHGPISLIVVDYLQLMRSGQRRTENRNVEITYISQGLKALAKEINCPVLALSQLSREVEKRTNKRPALADLRDSGAIEQDADLVMFIYRDEVYNKNKDKGIAEICISKQRNGPQGIVKIAFVDWCMCFENLAR